MLQRPIQETTGWHDWGAPHSSGRCCVLRTRHQRQQSGHWGEPKNCTNALKPQCKNPFIFHSPALAKFYNFSKMNSIVDWRAWTPRALQGQISRPAENHIQHLWDLLIPPQSVPNFERSPNKEIMFRLYLCDDNLERRCSRCWALCREYNLSLVKPGHNFSVGEFRLDWRNHNSGHFF